MSLNIGWDTNLNTGGLNMNRKFKHSSNSFRIFFLAAAIIILSSLGLTFAQSYGNAQTINCVVTGKESVTAREGDTMNNEYRVYTEDCGTLVVKDTLLHGKFNAADTYSEIDVNAENNFDTVGYRVPFLSKFPNIIEVNN